MTYGKRTGSKGIVARKKELLINIKMGRVCNKTISFWRHRFKGTFSGANRTLETKISALKRLDEISEEEDSIPAPLPISRRLPPTH
jgi:hypothetical protein